MVNWMTRHGRKHSELLGGQLDPGERAQADACVGARKRGSSFETVLSKHNEYSKLLELCSQVVESTAGEKVSPDSSWLADVHPFAAKLFFHLGSLFYLRGGTLLPPLAGKDIPDKPGRREANTKKLSQSLSPIPKQNTSPKNGILARRK